MDYKFPFHVIAACLAVWRITDLFLLDRITAKFRDKHPSYLWKCHRCMSVWAAIWATLVLAIYPWANWPFALAWIYLWHIEHEAAKRIDQRGRTFSVELKDGKFSVTRAELHRHEIDSILDIIFKPQEQPKQEQANTASAD